MSKNNQSEYEDVPKNINERIFSCIRDNDVESLKHLIALEKPNLNIRNESPIPRENGVTPLELAIRLYQDDTMLAQILIDAGADPNFPTRRGTSILEMLNISILFSKKHVALYLRLIDMGADIHTICGYNRTLLWDAMSSIDVVKKLVEKGINLNHQDEGGSTIKDFIKGEPQDYQKESFLYLREITGYRSISNLEEAIHLFEEQVTPNLDNAPESMKEFFWNFFSMVKDLAQNKDIVISRFRIGSPTSEKLFEAAENEYQIPVDPDLKSFYRVANGITLVWVHKKNPHFKKMKPKWDDRNLDWAELRHDEFRPDGLINILNFNEVMYSSVMMDSLSFLSESKGDLNFQGRKYNRADFYQNATHFDLFDSYNAMGFALLHKPGTPQVVMTGQHWGVFTDSIATTFPVYLRFLIQTKGIVSARSKAFRAPGNNGETVITDVNSLGYESPVDLNNFDFQKQ